MAHWFVLLGLLLFLVEIAWRRLWEGHVRQRVQVAAAAADAVQEDSTVAAAAIPKKTKRSKAAKAQPKPRTKSGQASQKGAAAKEAPSAPKKDLGDALSGAKRKAKRRTDK